MFTTTSSQERAELILQFDEGIRNHLAASARRHITTAATTAVLSSLTSCALAVLTALPPTTVGAAVESGPVLLFLTLVFLGVALTTTVLYEVARHQQTSRLQTVPDVLREDLVAAGQPVPERMHQGSIDLHSHLINDTTT